MVHADIGREPVQQRGQVVMRAAIQGRFMQVPLAVVLPCRVFELVLHIEEPDAGRGREKHDRKMHEQECFNADEPAERGGDQCDSEIGRHAAGPGLPAAAHQADRQAILEKEQIGGADAEHHQRMPVELVHQPAPSRKRMIFAYCQRIHGADAAAVEIAGGGMVDGMDATPHVIRRQGDHTDDAADSVVCPPPGKEGAMTAVVLDQEQAHHKTSGRDSNEEASPPKAQRVSEPGRGPQRHQRQCRDRQLRNAARLAWRAIRDEDLCPAACIDHRGTQIMSDAQDNVRGWQWLRIGIDRPL